MLRVLGVNWTGSPNQVDVIERHENVSDMHEARKILKEWMNPDDWISKEETIQDHKGNYVTPLLIVTPDGETLDVFGQLVTDEPPGPWPFNPE